MAKNAKVIFAIQNGQPLIQFSISDDVEGCAEEKFTELLNDLPVPKSVKDFLKELSPTRLLSRDEVEERDVPQQSVQQSKSGSDSAKKKSRISESQLSTLRDLLAKRRISESSFCAQHRVDRLENLPGGTAWRILHEWLS